MRPQGLFRINLPRQKIKGKPAMPKLPKFNCSTFFTGVTLGGTLGSITGAIGAAVTGSYVKTTASILGSGMGLFAGAKSFSGWHDGEETHSKKERKMKDRFL